MPAYQVDLTTAALPDREFMRRALRLGARAAARGEVPVGALVVRGTEILGSASNRVERAKDATAHAELLALRKAARRLDSWRLEGTTLYSTLEPCPMCAGAILLCRVGRVVYGTDDPKKGAFRSVYDVLGNQGGNHHPVVLPGCEGEPAGRILRTFFKGLRSRTA
ncbi:MAG TPA: nucleoside deaminase [Candidatus Dormibacteraeota bacterium]|nr:nucleoside deaminase [Candidatus Dormibacteraeota bacterium]